jgi:tetratricopeptide (TPR) repeat protein
LCNSGKNQTFTKNESNAGITLIISPLSLTHRIKKNFYLFLVALLIVISQPGCIALEMLMKAPSEESQDFLKVDISTLKNKDSCKKIGLKLLDSSNYPKAIDAFQKALEFDPNDPESNNYLGKIYFLTFDDIKAKMFLQIAISLKKNYADAYYNLGDVYFREGNLDRAMLNFKTAIQINESYRTKVRQFFGEGFIPLD